MTGTDGRTAVPKLPAELEAFCDATVRVDVLPVSEPPEGVDVVPGHPLLDLAEKCRSIVSVHRVGVLHVDMPRPDDILRRIQDADIAQKGGHLRANPIHIDLLLRR